MIEKMINAANEELPKKLNNTMHMIGKFTGHTTVQDILNLRHISK